MSERNLQEIIGYLKAFYVDDIENMILDPRFTDLNGIDQEYVLEECGRGF